MVYVYDVEIFPNFFSIVLWDIKGEEKLEYYIYKDHNDIDDICDLFNQKGYWFVGFNSTGYDDVIMESILSSEKRYRHISSKQITSEIFECSKEIIESDKTYYTKNLFNSFDLMRVGNINKSLKLVGVNLKHDKIQDLPFEFDHVVQDNEVEDILSYNHNDVEITYKLYHDLRDEIKLRQDLTKKYGQNLMDYPDSGIANRILENDYEEFSGLSRRAFKRTNTHRDIVHFKDCIHDKVYFHSDNLKSFLFNLKEEKADKSTKIEYSVLVGSTRYDILKGGIHSNMPPSIETSKDGVQIKDADVTSYYPYIMLNYDIKPEHLHDCFLSLLRSYVDTRVKAKKEGDKVASDGLKIVINSIN